MALTQKELWDISDLKVKALTEYCNFCIRHNEVPREEQIIMINGCNSKEALEKTIKIIINK